MSTSCPPRKSSACARALRLSTGHAHHYRGFANTQWDFFLKKQELKPLLYIFRVLLTGIHLMRTGVVQADLRELVQEVPEAPAYLGELMAAKAEPGRARASRQGTADVLTVGRLAFWAWDSDCWGPVPGLG
ncbi:DNA polymerase beta superfamily protein [Kribbella sp. CA-247076]|uniref:DNA polymerase beta superfamily protein n=1 Tax=Kribbella sp. CA-247076 TaxID=3239941 RepID=UPI003D910819